MLKALKLPILRKKILFSFLMIAVFRFMSHVPVPGVDVLAVRAYLQGNALLGMFDLFSGGGFQNFSIITLSLGPYINASIILQLFTTVVPKLEALSKEGESGREKINQYTRLLTLPLALAQAYGVFFLLNRQQVIGNLGFLDLMVFIATLTGGVMLLVWLGDLITEYGIGQGISLIIFVGIISRVPTSALQFLATLNAETIINSLIFVVISLFVIVGVVLINEGTRNVPLQYGRRGSQSSSVSNYLPIKVNQVGVIPIIFAASVVLVPSFLSGPMLAASNGTLQNIGGFLARNFVSTAFFYNAFYFLLVMGFTFFYTFMQYSPEKIADDVKRRGGFIPGIRPGRSTKDYLQNIVIRITLVGAVFLGLIAIMPYLTQGVMGADAQSAGAIGGSGLLIVVSVVLETIRQIEAQTVTRSYEGFLD